ncbi:MAG: FAD-dependent oxidoreductase [Proteobacteria bacterium]|nr:FAD-dependent oxidoreductase [Pseudomonadota bacterium]
MFLTYKSPVYEYIKSPDQTSVTRAHHPLVVVGAGPVGMAAAIDAGIQGLRALVLDDNNTVSVGSRAVCWSKRALEILDRLGCAERMVAKGVTWKVGKTFYRDKLIRQFDLLPASGYKQPAFINLQQYYLEEYLVERLNQLDNVMVRWKNKVIGVAETEDSVLLTIDTPDGVYNISCDWLVVADGANSTVRSLVGLESKGQVFEDRFLIADILMKADFPPERWFSFDPSYHRGWSTLLHRQPDNLWRLDFQLGADADPEEEKKPENVIPRVKAMMGDDVEFELEWASIYNFSCRQMDKFRHGRLLFVGDAAHQVSPFGARGANSGFQDTDNLIWKLKLVMENKAPKRLLDSYDAERVPAARENLLNSTRTTDFMSPKSGISKIFRNAVLELASDFEFARDLSNSGRLSDPAILSDSSLNTADEDSFAGELVPGNVVADAPVKGLNGESWLLSVLSSSFHLLYFTDSATELGQKDIEALQRITGESIPVQLIIISDKIKQIPGLFVLEDSQGMAKERFDGEPGTTYLVRPDQHVAARWRVFDFQKVVAALKRATCNE